MVAFSPFRFLQLGDDVGSGSLAFAPITIGNPYEGRLRVTAVACGLRHTLALVGESGSVFAFGESKHGQLGLGETDGEPVTVPTPVLLPDGAAEAVAVACGSQHSFVLDSDGVVHASGRGRHGQLGLGDTITQAQVFDAIHTREDGSDLPTFTAVASGWQTGYAIDTEVSRRS